MKIKEFRKEHRYTQKKLADALKVNQQTIARWENGKTEPNIQQLRDLAMIFHTSVDAILGKERRESPMPNYGLEDDPKTEFYWGYVGIYLNGNDDSRWFPITASCVKILDRQIKDKNRWLLFETLNNRYVAVNRNNIKYITLTNEDAEEPHNWPVQLTWFEEMLPIEAYSGLDRYISGELDEENLSSNYQEGIDRYIKDNDLTTEDIEKIIIGTNIYDKKGIVLNNLYASEESLLDLFSNFEDDWVGENEFIEFGEPMGGNYHLFNESKLALIDAPRLMINEAVKGRILEEAV